MNVLERRGGWSKNVVIVLALLAAGFLAAWLRLRPHLELHATYTDGLRTYDSLASRDVRHAVWEDPRPLTGSVNTAGHEGRPALSPDGRYLVFAAGRPGVDADLWIARLEEGIALDARPLHALNTEHDELAPAFGAGELWFASNRPGGAGGLDLYRAPYRDGEVGPPRRAHDSLQSRADDTDPAPLPDGSLLFASNRDGRKLGFELYLARPRSDGSAQAGFALARVEALSSPADEREPALASGARALFFSSDRAERGVSRLYRSLLEDGAWLPPEPVAGLPAGARGAAPAADGFTLLFSLPGELGGADIWRARSIELLRRPGRPAGWLDAALLAALLVLALLAWLAKRWERLDVVYKCFLVSLLAHVGLLLWTRGVQATAEPIEASPGRTFEVRLAQPSGPAARELERGGRLELASSSARPALEAPARREVDLAPPAAPAPLPRPMVAPERETQPAARAQAHELPAPRSETAARALRGLSEQVERSGALAPELALGPRSLASPGRAASARRELPPPALERPPAGLPLLPAAGAPPRTALALEPGAAPAPATRARGVAARSDLAPALRTTALALRQPAEDAPGTRELLAGEADSPAGRELQPPILALARPAPSRREAAQAGPARWQPGAGGAASHARAPGQLDLPLPLPSALPAPRPRPTLKPPATPYALRFGSARLRAVEEHGGSAETEAAVAAGLRYLASVQHAEGFWGSLEDRDPKYGHVLVGKTGLCLLAFLGAGHVPAGERGPGTGEHAEVARRAVEFLLAVQEPSTGHFGYTSAYSHGIATYALAECFALNADPRLRAPLEKAVARILAAQDRTSGDRRRDGGWGYFYPDDRVFDTWPRTSISAWQVMALASARLSGIAVPDEALDGARGFLERAWDARLGAYRYVHDPSRLRSGWPTLPASTPAALFALSLLGADLDDEGFTAARRYVLERRPSALRRVSNSEFVSRATGNLYFYYYGSLALFRQGGREWEVWNTALKESLLPAQLADGSWSPTSPYARYAGDDAQDRSYTTAMCVLSLEIYYRYFTPLLRAR